MFFFGCLWRSLRGHNWVHFAHSALLPEFKRRYLENLKLFLIRVKELFEPTVVKKKKKKKKKGDGCLLFLKTLS